MPTYSPLRAAIALCLSLVPVACSPLGAYNAVIAKDAGGARVASDIAYGSDARQRLDVYAPDGPSRGVVVFVYGGSWNSGARGDYAFVGRALAARGYVTVIPDYRLVPTVRYPDFVQDTARAVAWTSRNAAQYGGDAGGLFVVGHSAGAYNALMVALAPEFLADEGLSPSIVTAAAGLSGPYDFLPLAGNVTKAAFGGARDLDATQPVNRAQAGRGTPAVFLAHGEADTVVLPRNSRVLADRLREAGKRVDTKFYPGVDHVGTLLAISRPRRDTLPVLDDLVAFLDGF